MIPPAEPKPGGEHKREGACVLLLDHSPEIGGAELSLIELAETLRPPYKPVLACTPNCPAFIEAAKQRQIEVFTVEMPRLRGIWGPLAIVESITRLCRLIRKVRPDIVHSNTTRTHIISAFAGRLCGVKVVWTVRDFTFPRWLYRLLSSIPSRIVCVSQAVEETYRLRTSKTRVILNGVIPPRLDKGRERERIRSEFNIPHDAPVALCAGRLVKWKGQDYFLKAAALVKEKVPDAYFMVVGDGESEAYKECLRNLASSNGLSEKVIFTGFRKDVLSCMCAADVLVHSSVEPEPFGRVLIEAMAVGTPIVASALGGPLEIIEDGMSGLLVQPRDVEQLAKAMVRVMCNPDMASRLSQAGMKRFYEKFDQALETEAIEAVYDELLGFKKVECLVDDSAKKSSALKAR